ncbi:hypothetical protein MYU51_003769 [Penicillium brevicompactum]
MAFQEESEYPLPGVSPLPRVWERLAMAYNIRIPHYSALNSSATFLSPDLYFDWEACGADADRAEDLMVQMAQEQQMLTLRGYVLGLGHEYLPLQQDSDEFQSSLCFSPIEELAYLTYLKESAFWDKDECAEQLVEVSEKLLHARFEQTLLQLRHMQGAFKEEPYR